MTKNLSVLLQLKIIQVTKPRKFLLVSVNRVSDCQCRWSSPSSRHSRCGSQRHWFCQSAACY